MCKLFPGNLYLRGVIADNHAQAVIRFFKQYLTVQTELARRSLPPKGGGPSGRSLERGHRAPLFRPPPCCAALRACSPLRRAPPRVGYAAPPPQGGLARSGVPPSRLGRAVGLSPWLFVRCRRMRRPLCIQPCKKNKTLKFIT